MLCGTWKAGCTIERDTHELVGGLEVGDWALLGAGCARIHQGVLLSAEAGQQHSGVAFMYVISLDSSPTDMVGGTHRGKEANTICMKNYAMCSLSVASASRPSRSRDLDLPEPLLRAHR